MIPFWLRALATYCHHSPLKRGQSRLISWAYRRYHPAGTTLTDSLLDGTLPIQLDLTIWIDFNIYCQGLYEYYLAAWFKSQLKADTVFLDVGAYIGQYALLAAQVALSGRVYAFEPNPHSFQRLAQSRQRHHFNHLQLLPMAVGSQTGNLPFYLADEPFQSSTIATHAAYNQTIAVPLIGLDDFCRQEGLKRVDLLKIDVEEAEDAVIAGAMALLERFRPGIIIEIGGQAIRAGQSNALNHLQTLGYHFWEMRSGRIIPLTALHPPSTNVIALPATSYLPPAPFPQGK